MRNDTSNHCTSGNVWLAQVNQRNSSQVVWCPPDKFGNRRDCDARLEPDPFLKFNNPCQRYFTWSRWLVVSEKDNGMKNFRDDWKHRHKNKDNYLINKEK